MVAFHGFMVMMYLVFAVDDMLAVMVPITIVPVMVFVPPITIMPIMVFVPPMIVMPRPVDTAIGVLLHAVEAMGFPT